MMWAIVLLVVAITCLAWLVFCSGIDAQAEERESDLEGNL